MEQCVKPPVATQTSHISVLVDVSAVLLPIPLPAKVPGKQQNTIHYLDPCHTCERTGWQFWLLVLA